MDCLQKKLQEMEEKNPSVSLRTNSKPSLKELINFVIRDKLGRVSLEVKHDYFRIKYIEGFGYLKEGENDYQEFHPTGMLGYWMAYEDIGKLSSFLDKYGVEPMLGAVYDRQELSMNSLREMHRQLGIFEAEEQLREDTKEYEGKKIIEVFIDNFDFWTLFNYNCSCRNERGRTRWKFDYCMEAIDNPEQRLEELREGKEESDFTIDTSGYDGWLNPE